MKYLFILILLLIFTGLSYSDSLTSNDLKVIQFADIYSAEIVVSKIMGMYTKEGVNSIETSIPVIANRAITIINNVEQNNRYLRDAEGEFLGDLVWILSVSEDIRAKDALLKLMVSSHVSGDIINNGLLNLGKQVIPDILNYFEGENKETIKNTIPTLIFFAENDSLDSFFTETNKNKIKEKLITLTSENDENARYGAVKALGYFGDSSVIPLLKKIREDDIMQLENGAFPIRNVASESIKRLDKKE